MKRLLMSTAIVGLAALPGFAIAQSDQADDTKAQEQTQTDSQTGTGAGVEAETGAETGSGSSMENGAQSETDMGGTSKSVSGDDQGDSSMGGSTGADAEGSSDMGTGSGSDDMTSGDKPEVSEGHSEADASTVEASEVEGAPVMTREEEDLGNVSEVLMTEDGSIEAIVVNVGGMLGIGSKPVEVPFDEVTLQRNDEDDELSIIIPMSQQELEDMPRYEED
ncbi:MAG: PRC-barrel domain-containing protein [Roseovarius sp.]|nr:PRC-barrel domain-containing protein [Roseovarius sp.]